MRRYKRLTPDTYRSVNAVIKQYCCNYYDGNCILLDSDYPCTCPQSISYSLLCKWFRDNVLPNDRKLYGELLIAEKRKKCFVCGKYFIANSNRAKYCSDCRERITRLQAAQRKRKQREMSRLRTV